jgi:hypothetical protein
LFASRLRIAAGARRAVTRPVAAGSWRTVTRPVAGRAGAACRLVAVATAIWAAVAGGFVIALAAGRLAIAAGTTVVVRGAFAVAGSGLDFEFDDLVPLLVAAIAFGNSEQFAQTAARIRGRCWRRNRRRGTGSATGAGM